MLLLFIGLAPFALCAQFGEQQFFGGLDGADQILAGDFDGDGDPDVVGFGGLADRVEIYENLGNEQFAAGTAIVLSGAGRLASGDMDQDGKLDLITTINGTCYWMRNMGGLQFDYVPLGIVLDFGLTVADVDGDGILDILMVGNHVVWYKNLGGCALEGPYFLTDESMTLQAAVGDLDGDGDPDVAHGYYSSGSFVWYPNQGDGTFGGPQTIVPYAGENPYIAIADLDEDGDLDIACQTGPMEWYANDGQGHFTFQHQFDPTPDYTAFAITCRDIEGDGDVDVLFAYPQSVIICINQGHGVFTGPQIITTQVDWVYGMDAADLDGDGDLEPLVASHYADAFTWYDNLTFQTAIEEVTSTATALHVFPNPMADHAWVTWPTAANGQAQVAVLDLTGQVVQQLPMREGRAIIERGPLAGGAYLLRCTDGAGTVAAARLLLQ